MLSTLAKGHTVPEREKNKKQIHKQTHTHPCRVCFVLLLHLPQTVSVLAAGLWEVTEAPCAYPTCD